MTVSMKMPIPNNTSRRIWLYLGLLSVIFLLLIAAGCTLAADKAGTLMLQVSTKTRSISWTSLPEVVSYRIEVEGPDGTAEYFFDGESTLLLLERLTPGIYELSVTGYDGEQGTGHPIVWLQENSEGTRNLTLEIMLGEITMANAYLVPNTEGAGLLEFSMEFSELEETLLLKQPQINIGLEHIEGKVLSSESIGAALMRKDNTLLEGEDYSLEFSSDERQLVITVSEGEESQKPEDTLVHLSALPGGWYAMTIELESLQALYFADAPENQTYEYKRVWGGIYFFQVMQDIPNTEGVIRILSREIETGSGLIEIGEDMNHPLVVEITDSAAAETLVLDGHRYLLSEQGKADVIFSATAGYQEYYWYINGVEIGNNSVETEAGAELSHTFTDSGIYTVTVFTLDGGAFGSSSLDISIER